MGYDSETNERMVRVAPELNSKWATYPLKRFTWINPSEQSTGVSGDHQPPFIPREKDPNFPDVAMKKDYVWGPGTRGYGYYHLLTREAYVALSQRVRGNRPNQHCCSCCFGSSNSNFSCEDYDIVSNILHNRSIAAIPDDKLAYQKDEKDTRSEVYINAVTADVRLSPKWRF
eukprot:714046_1